MNIPLFVFVVVALRATANGSSKSSSGGESNQGSIRNTNANWADTDTGDRGQPVFLFCAALLLVAALVTLMYAYLHVGKDTPEGFSEIPSQDLAGVNLYAPSGAELNPDVDDASEEYA